MKKTYRFQVEGRTVERSYFYIPVRYIIAVLITLAEVLAVIGIVMALCYYVPYFYILAWLTEIACVVRIIASDDNPDYKVPWLLFVLIIPIAGFMLYFMFYSRKLQKRFVRRLDAMKAGAYRKEDTALFEKLKEDSPVAHSQAKNADKHCRYAPVYEHEADLFSAGRGYAQAASAGPGTGGEVYLHGVLHY